MNETLLRLAQVPPHHAKRIKPRRCSLHGCSKTTREGKPYCPEHVDHLAYVKQVRKLLDAASREARMVRAYARRQPQRAAELVDVEGVNAQDVMSTLHVLGRATVQRIHRDAFGDRVTSTEVTHCYLLALEAAGYVRPVGEVRRGYVGWEVVE